MLIGHGYMPLWLSAEYLSSSGMIVWHTYPISIVASVKFLLLNVRIAEECKDSGRVLSVFVFYMIVLWY